MRYLRSCFAAILFLMYVQAHPADAYGSPAEKTKGKYQEMREEIARQNSRIEQLEHALAQQAKLLEQLRVQLEGGPHNVHESQPAAASESAPADSATAQQADSSQAVVASAKVATAESEEPGRIFAGLQLSGDFRFRFDVQARSSNFAAPPLQNIRGRYRVRLNADRDIDSRFRFHMQLSTGHWSNQTTNDQEFGGMATKPSFALSEAYIDFHPNQDIELRGGRMEEVFADNMRFLWDDDIRFNGFHEVLRIHTPSPKLHTLEFRGGQYILSNPNVVVLSPGSPFVSAGYKPGGKVRDSILFHQGVVLKGNFGTRWNQQLTSDIQVYRNPNQIQLSSLPTGFPVLISNWMGIVLSAPPGGLGNATTTPGGAIYSAPNFQVGRLAYRVETKSLPLGEHSVPFWFDLQLSRNFGTSRWQDAAMATVNFGAVRKARDVRFLYQWAIKDPNSMISQFTDDDLGTGSGVNITVHEFRVDIGITRFLQWQNLFFVQNQRRPSIPSQQLFVPLPWGANPTFRFLGQLLFTW